MKAIISLMPNHTCRRPEFHPMIMSETPLLRAEASVVCQIFFFLKYTSIYLNSSRVMKIILGQSSVRLPASLFNANKFPLNNANHQYFEDLAPSQSPSGNNFFTI